MNKIPLTKQGIIKLENERNKLKTIDRPNVIAAISAARELGDLSENAEYHAAKEQQGFIEARIQQLDGIISSAEVVDPSTIQSSTIIFGATVTLEDCESEVSKTYQIVGDHEADIEKNLISYSSPLGKMLIGKEEGDVVEINGKQKKEWEILKIEYK